MVFDLHLDYFGTLRLRFNSSWQDIHGKILQNEHVFECKFELEVLFKFAFQHDFEISH